MKAVLIVFILAISFNIQAQVAINIDGTLPDNSSMLDVKSTVKGILIPRMTLAEMLAIPGPATGLMVYNTTSQAFYNYNGSIWIMLTAGSAIILKDADGDTKVEPEKYSDEDMIRFSLAGIEKMVLKSNRLEFADPTGNIFIGSFAGALNASGSANTALGFFSLGNNVSGQRNVGIGYYTLLGNSAGSDNIALGASAMQLNTGSSNVAVGSNALYSNTSGSNATAVGYNAMQYADNSTNPFINYNVAVGYESLRGSVTPSSNTGSYNTSVGYQTLRNNNSGASNTATGHHALFSNTSGNFNTANGNVALFSNLSGGRNTCIGYGALYANTTGYWNTASGAGSLQSNVSGNGNTASGDKSLFSNTTGEKNCASGSGAMKSNTLGSNNTAMGEGALYSNISGYSNVAFGINALYSSIDRKNIVAIGDSALYNNGIGASASYEAASNTAIGSKALYTNTLGDLNTALGYQALYSNSTGHGNNAIGAYALNSNTKGTNNSAFGTWALISNTTANRNIAIGNGAMQTQSFSNGGESWNSDNVAIGYGALNSNQPISTITGIYNTATGNESLTSNTTGSYNSANGFGALYTNTTGNNNTAIGGHSSYYTNSDNNTSVGYAAGDNLNFSHGTFVGAQTHPGVADITNCMALGYNAQVSASNRVVIGNTGVNSIGGYAGWTNFSDQRYKTAVQENVKGLEFIMKLRPVTYRLDINKLVTDMREDQRRDDNGNIIMGSPSAIDTESRNEKSRIVYTGFLAQEVEAAAQSIGFDFSGVDAPKNDNDFYGLRYAEFVVPLVKAVQEQQEIIEQLKAENARLEERLTRIESKISRK